MGRRAKNANHPLVRLRTLMRLTRKELSEKTNIPESSLKDIEAGKYQMSDENVASISIATGVHPQSLLNDDDLLLDISGSHPLTLDSLNLEYLAETLVHKPTLALLVSLALDAATEKQVSYQFQFLLHGWLCKTSKRFGLERLIREKLTAELGTFVPGAVTVPAYLMPKTPHAKALWKKFGDDLLKEQMLIYEDRLAQDPMKAARQKRFYNKPRTNDPALMAWEKEFQHDLAECRELALEKLMVRRKAARARAAPTG